MTPAAALWPHEIVCPTCSGKATEICELCDGTGVIVADRRALPSEIREVWTEAQRVANELAIARIELRAKEAMTAHLEQEIRDLRAALARREAR